MHGAQVMEALKGAKATASSGIDEIPMSVLKRVGPMIIDEIVDLTNKIIEECKWPEQWKFAEIKPIWKKKGNRKNPKFYRPVALLPAIARLVERILAQQIKKHLKEKGVLPKFQHGFRAEHSPESAITELITQIAKARDQSLIALVATLDLAGAFDTIDHGMLCEKLEKFAVSRGEYWH